MPAIAPVFPLLLVVAGLADSQSTFTETPVYVTAVELVAQVRDAQGGLPRDLTAADFAVFEDGVEKPVIGVDYLRPRETAAVVDDITARKAPASVTEEKAWRIVLYFDLFLSSSKTIREAADSLILQADELARRGTVDVVVSEPGTSSFLRDSRDPDAIRKALLAVRRRAARNFLVAHRRMYQAVADRGFERPQNGGLGGILVDAVIPVLPFVMEEIAAVRRSQSALVNWLAQYPRQTPRALFMISEGFELDPLEYYAAFALDPTTARSLRAESLNYRLGAETESLALLLAAAAWVTVSINGGLGSGEQWIDDASRFSLGRVRRPRPKEPIYATSGGREPLLAYADATGGSVTTRANIPAVISDLGDRVVIVYQLSRPPDGKAHRVKVVARRPGITVQVSRWSSEGTPEELATARALAMLKDPQSQQNDLPTTVTLAWTSAADGEKSGTITIRTPLAPLQPLLLGRNGVFRVTIAAQQGNREPTVIHRIVNRTSGEAFLYRAPLQARDGQLQIAVAVEELTTGMWGGGHTK